MFERFFGGDRKGKKVEVKSNVQFDEVDIEANRVANEEAKKMRSEAVRIKEIADFVIDKIEEAIKTYPNNFSEGMPMGDFIDELEEKKKIMILLN